MQHIKTTKEARNKYGFRRNEKIIDCQVTKKLKMQYHRYRCLLRQSHVNPNISEAASSVSI